MRDHRWKKFFLEPSHLAGLVGQVYDASMARPILASSRKQLLAFMTPGQGCMAALLKHQPRRAIPAHLEPLASRTMAPPSALISANQPIPRANAKLQWQRIYAASAKIPKSLGPGYW